MPAAISIPMLIGLTGASAGAQVAGAVIGSKAAKSAAKTQAAAADQSLAFQKQQYQQSRQDFAPYQQQGAQAVGQLGAMTQARPMTFDPAQPQGLPRSTAQTGQLGMAAPGGTVRVQAPTGEIAMLTAQQAQAAVAKGARVMA
jgi:hypothetical protein